jgi:hypothetical protein
MIMHESNRGEDIIIVAPSLRNRRVTRLLHYIVSFYGTKAALVHEAGFRQAAKRSSDGS